MRNTAALDAIERIGIAAHVPSQRGARFGVTPFDISQGESAQRNRAIKRAAAALLDALENLLCSQGARRHGGWLASPR